MNIGHAISIPIPETQKYEPAKRERNLSAITPPRSVEISPATTVIKPKKLRDMVRKTAGEVVARYAARDQVEG